MDVKSQMKGSKAFAAALKAASDAADSMDAMAAEQTSALKELVGEMKAQRATTERQCAAMEAHAKSTADAVAEIGKQVALLGNAMAADDDGAVVKAIAKLSVDLKPPKPGTVTDRTPEIVAAIGSLRTDLALVVETLMAPVDLETNNYGEPVSAIRRRKKK